MKAIQEWLSEYGESHQNSTNKAIHWVCVPLIFFSITGLLYSIKVPFNTPLFHPLNVAHIALAAIFIYYTVLSWRLAIGMVLFGFTCLFACYWIETNFKIPLWQVSLLIFVVAWIGQFYGHKIEGKKPSFLKDIQFLLIGPAWLMSFIYSKLGIRL